MLKAQLELTAIDMITSCALLRPAARALFGGDGFDYRLPAPALGQRRLALRDGGVDQRGHGRFLKRCGSGESNESVLVSVAQQHAVWIRQARAIEERQHHALRRDSLVCDAV